MNFFDFIDPLVFMIAICIGLAYTYATSPPPVVLIKYPTPFNINDTIYQDNAGLCYKYKIKEVQCPIDKDKITYVKPDEN